MSGSNYHVNLRNLGHAIYHDAHRRAARARGHDAMTRVDHSAHAGGPPGGLGAGAFGRPETARRSARNV